MKLSLLFLVVLVSPLACGNPSAPGEENPNLHGSEATIIGDLRQVADEAQPEPAPRIRHVIILSIDGLRPQDMLRAQAPNLHRLAAEGASTMTAATILPSVTLPAHASMLTGVSPSRHRVLWNEWDAERGLLSIPTIFTVARERGLPTAMVVNKFKLRHLSTAVDVFSHAGFTAATAVEAATPLLRQDPPAILFLHFADPDSAGHEHGWGSHRYVAAIERCDVALGALLTVVEEAGFANETLWLVTADHGGLDRTHGSNHPDDVTIPWITYGPGIKAGRVIDQAVSIMDTAATALAALRLQVPEGWEGRPVLETLPEAVFVTR